MQKLFKRNEVKKMTKRVTIHVCTLNRHAELVLLLQSLRTQTYQNWDLVILDQSQVQIESVDYLVKLINRIKLENHFVNILYDKPQGVCYARNKIIEQDHFNNPLVCRLDDDVIIEQDYLERLVRLINKGYDIASGVTPILWDDGILKDNSTVDKIINEKRFDKRGNIIHYGDDCGQQYLYEEYFDSDEFRSCAMMTRKVIENVKYPINLSSVGFREEAFFSLKARWLGFKIGVDVKAVAYHVISGSGGVRDKDYQNKVISDNNYFIKWSKEQYNKHGDFHGNK